MHTLKLWLKTLQLGAFDCIFYNNGPAAEHIAMHCELGKVPFESELYNRGATGALWSIWHGGCVHDCPYGQPPVIPHQSPHHQHLNHHEGLTAMFWCPDHPDEIILSQGTKPQVEPSKTPKYSFFAQADNMFCTAAYKSIRVLTCVKQKPRSCEDMYNITIKLTKNPPCNKTWNLLIKSLESAQRPPREFKISMNNILPKNFRGCDFLFKWFCTLQSSTRVIGFWRRRWRRTDAFGTTAVQCSVHIFDPPILSRAGDIQLQGSWKYIRQRGRQVEKVTGTVTSVGHQFQIHSSMIAL